MRKYEFIAKVAKQAGCYQETANNVLFAMKKVIDTQLIEKSKARLPLFGNFTIKKRRARRVYNPQTKERTLSKEKVYIHFKPFDAF